MMLPAARSVLSPAWIARFLTRLLLVGASAAGAGVLREEGGVWEGGVRGTLLTRAELFEVRPLAAPTSRARDRIRCTLYASLGVCTVLWVHVRATYAYPVVVVGRARCAGEPSYPDIRPCFCVRTRVRGPSE